MVIFVAGVHGVGKTHLCQTLASKTGLRHASASQLIKEERKVETWRGDKVVTEIGDNQDALNIAVDRIRREASALILDGHFVLKGPGGSLEEVPTTTFERLRLSAIILIENTPQLIAERLLQRDSNNTIGGLEDFIRSERRAAINSSINLGIPFFLMHGPSAESFADCVESILEFSARN
ncbi:ATP-binding protein [Pseudomonas corrugata]|uniref:ATP-binding protein n=1 Tax=Pseudomonas corrugata TaxID=47879 RepID=UPI0028C3E77A|nr:ATP-binding protein [Pseudomonas corrugata]MDU9024221.1 ATP-binding protein [Pseudomonas corrugata]